jgi:putative ubiquitin-RnfH superfamily antitoxin RatB of RatAB toxin-antitoxin module
LNAQITVEIAYALPEKQLIKTLEVPLGTTAQQAVGASGIAQAFDGLIPEDSQLGIFGKVVANDQILREGDRIEIYRSLIADPKVVRKERAAKARRARSEKKA